MPKAAAADSPALASLANFHQLPLPLRINKSSCRSVQRYHFVKSLKPASGQDAEDGDGDERPRTLVVANFDGTAADLQLVYGRYGAIDRVDVGNKRQAATEKGVGRVVFEEAVAVRKVLQQTLRQAQANSQQVAADEEEAEEVAATAANQDSSDEDEEDGWETTESADKPAPPPLLGINKWLTEYFAQRPGIRCTSTCSCCLVLRLLLLLLLLLLLPLLLLLKSDPVTDKLLVAHPGPEGLQALADSELAAYDERRKEADRRANEMADMPDEDGFVKVIRRRNGRGSQSDSSVTVRGTKLEAANGAAAKAVARGAGQFGDFYKFQKRERADEEKESLKRKFAADRERVFQAKQARKKRESDDAASAAKRKAVAAVAASLDDDE